MQKMKLGHFIIPYERINSKQIKDLSVRPEAKKLLEENIGSQLSDIALSDNIFSNISSQAKETRENKWDYNQLKSFCTAK